MLKVDLYTVWQIRMGIRKCHIGYPCPSHMTHAIAYRVRGQIRRLTVHLKTRDPTLAIQLPTSINL